MISEEASYWNEGINKFEVSRAKDVERNSKNWFGGMLRCLLSYQQHITLLPFIPVDILHPKPCSIIQEQSTCLTTRY